ncbi:uncharacterized protein LOC131955957 [Physella acuta]|uniref:uncharacterized protein LOC131955957 n=1 Tax=Physella acuta TaxID=109671 RepID=UPI0027DC8325|nr:uncharacterized protein LOC131955957 [Physella acuta]
MRYSFKRRLGDPRPEPNGHDKSVQVKPGNGCSPASMSSPMIKSQSGHVICESSGAEICSWSKASCFDEEGPLEMCSWSKANCFDEEGALEMCSWSKANCFDEGGALAPETPRRTGWTGSLKAEKLFVFLQHYYNGVLPTLIGISLASLVLLLMCIQMSDVKMKNVCSPDELSDLNIIRKELAIMEQHVRSNNMSVTCEDVLKKLTQLELDGRLKTSVLKQMVSHVMDQIRENGDVMLLGYPKTEMIGASPNDSSLQKLEADGPLYHESHLISLHDTRM